MQCTAQCSVQSQRCRSRAAHHGTARLSRGNSAPVKCSTARKHYSTEEHSAGNAVQSTTQRPARNRAQTSLDLSRTWWGNHVNHNFSAPGFIKDKNDNPPFFPKQHYTAEGPEAPTSATR
jgi:hypothetical protein